MHKKICPEKENLRFEDIKKVLLEEETFVWLAIALLFPLPDSCTFRWKHTHTVTHNT